MWMSVLMVSLSMIFAAALALAFVMKHTALEWRIEGSPGLPSGLGGASAAMLAQAWVLQGARDAILHNRDRQLIRQLAFSILLGLVFLGFEIANWQQIQSALQPGQDDGLYVSCFLLLTGLQTIPVLCGFPPLLVVLYRAGQHEYTSSHCEPVKLCVQYWHFLAALWFVIIAGLVIVTYV
jgi:cytochrome c oxidase subunit III